MRLDPKTRRSLRLVSGLGFSIAFCIGVSILGGVWLDERLQSRPIFVLAGILFGLFGAASIMYSLARPRSRINSSPRSEDGDRE
jgi:putative Ca2+/H+ antiporter (TMEM165/GDT1 family)